MGTLKQRLHRSDAEIAYEDSGGPGRAVVLLHGAGVDHSMFEAQAQALTRQGHRVVLLDLRGHGQSGPSPRARVTAADLLEDLGALLTICGTDAAVLVGHSLGGNLAQDFARRYPERVGGVIVLDSTWNTGPLSALERLALRISAPALGMIPAARLPRIMARASAETEGARARAEALFARMPKERFLEVWSATTAFVAPDPRHRSAVPLALVRGAEDRTGNISSAMPRWAEAEGIEEHVIPGAGHMVTWDAPAEVSQLLLRILEDWRVH